MIFLNSASSAEALVFYLPGVCTHTDTEGKQSPKNILKSSKNTIFNEHPVPPVFDKSRGYQRKHKVDHREAKNHVTGSVAL